MKIVKTNINIFCRTSYIMAKPKNLPAVDAASKSIPVTPLGKGDHL
jgi:hypothetical protein